MNIRKTIALPPLKALPLLKESKAPHEMVATGLAIIMPEFERIEDGFITILNNKCLSEEYAESCLEKIVQICQAGAQKYKEREEQLSRATRQKLETFHWESSRQTPQSKRRISDKTMVSAIAKLSIADHCIKITATEIDSKPSKTFIEEFKETEKAKRLQNDQYISFSTTVFREEREHRIRLKEENFALTKLALQAVIEGVDLALSKELEKIFTEIQGLLLYAERKINAVLTAEIEKIRTDHADRIQKLNIELAKEIAGHQAQATKFREENLLAIERLNNERDVKITEIRENARIKIEQIRGEVEIARANALKKKGGPFSMILGTFGL